MHQKLKILPLTVVYSELGGYGGLALYVGVFGPLERKKIIKRDRRDMVVELKVQYCGGQL